MKFFILYFVLPYVIGQCPDPPAEPVTCKGSELLCGGEPDAKGCPMPMWCQWVDPYEPCSARQFCPTSCPEDMMKCPGGEDPDGCPMPDMCIPNNPDCPTNCPVMCSPQEMPCAGGFDAEGCQMPDTCMWMDPMCNPTCTYIAMKTKCNVPVGMVDLT